jgi:hypothetical protein
MGPWPPGKKTAAKSSARPRKDASGAVDSHSADCSAWKDCEMGSLAAASTEAGSRGAGPPAGAARVRWKPWVVRMA